MKIRIYLISSFSILLVMLSLQFVIPNMGEKTTVSSTKKEVSTKTTTKKVVKRSSTKKRKVESKKSTKKTTPKKKVNKKKKSSVQKQKSKKVLLSTSTQKYTHYDSTAQDSFYWSDFGRASFKVYKQKQGEKIP